MKEWDSKFLEIKWHEKAHSFYVVFKANGSFFNEVHQTLAQVIPIQIADTSRCECGGSLTVGDQKMIFSDSDFRFKAVFYCKKCKLEREIKADGLGEEN